MDDLKEAQTVLLVNAIFSLTQPPYKALYTFRSLLPMENLRELPLYIGISLYRIFSSTELSKVGLPLPVSLFLGNRGGFVNECNCSSDRVSWAKLPFHENISDQGPSRCFL